MWYSYLPLCVHLFFFLIKPLPCLVPHLSLFFCQKGAQISFSLLQLHHLEENSRGADSRRVSQAAERETEVHDCMHITSLN